MKKIQYILLLLAFSSLLSAQKTTVNYKIPLNLSLGESSTRITADFSSQGDLVLIGNRIIRERSELGLPRKRGGYSCLSWFKIIDKLGYQEIHYNFLPSSRYWHLNDLAVVDSGSFFILGEESLIKRQKKYREVLFEYNVKGELQQKKYLPTRGNRMVAATDSSFLLLRNPSNKKGPLPQSILNSYQLHKKGLKARQYTFSNQEYYTMLYDGICTQKGQFALLGFENKVPHQFSSNCQKTISLVDASGNFRWKYVFDRYFYIKHTYAFCETSKNSLLVADYAPRDSCLLLTSLDLDNGQKKWEKCFFKDKITVQYIQELKDQTILIFAIAYDKDRPTPLLFQLSPQGEILQQFILPLEESEQTKELQLLTLRQKTTEVIELIFFYKKESNSLNPNTYLLSLDLKWE